MTRNESYTIDGVKKDFLAWCKLYNVRPEIIRSRMSLGQSLDEALHTFSNNTDKLFRIDGEVHTIQHWCRIYNINYSTVGNRLKHGWSTEDAFKMPPKRKVPRTNYYEVNGQTFTLAELSVQYEINQTTIKNRLKKGETIKQALDLEPTKRRTYKDKDNRTSPYALYTYQGQTKTLSEWAEDKKIEISTIRNRIKAGYSFAEAIEATTYIGAQKHDVEGRSMTLEEIEQEYGVDRRLIYKRIKEYGYSVLDAIKADNSTKTYLYQGEWLTIPEICKRTNIKRITIYARLKKGMTLEEAVSKPIADRGKLYSIHNEELTLKQISKKYDVSYSRLYTKVVIDKMSVEEAVVMRKARTFEIDGNVYSIAQLAEIYGVKAQTIRQRLREGNSIEEALRPSERKKK